MAREQFPITLRHSYDISPQVRHLVFDRADAQPFDFIPGQFINVHFADQQGDMVQRSYSVATIHDTKHALEIAIARVEGGKATHCLFHLKEGEQIHASGPFGRLILKDEAIKRYILVATGTGVAPYRSMINQFNARLQQAPALNILVVLGVRQKVDGLYVDDFLKLMQEQPRFQFHICYSQENNTELGDHEHVGRVTHFMQQLGVHKGEDIVYLCGHPDMIDELFAHLKTQNFDNTDVRREKYVFSH